jgi:peptide/nickel transport system permease protein
MSAVATTAGAPVPAIRRPSIGLQWRLIRNGRGRLGLILVTAIVLLALVAPAIAPYDPLEQHPGLELRGPSFAYLLGTDELGRDVLSRLMFGARTAIAIALIAVGLATIFGILTGLTAGYFGGLIDLIIMRMYDVILTFPGILVGVAVVTVLGPGSVNVAFALAVGLLPIVARLVRASVLAEREREHVLAARSCGARGVRIMWRHILPNALSPLIVTVALSAGFTILGEASLSFLGLGTQPPDPSWGGMLNTARGYLRVAPLYGVWPGLLLMVMIYGLNCLADGLRDALDPRGWNR